MNLKQRVKRLEVIVTPMESRPIRFIRLAGVTPAEDGPKRVIGDAWRAVPHRGGTSLESLPDEEYGDFLSRIDAEAPEDAVFFITVKREDENV